MVDEYELCAKAWLSGETDVSDADAEIRTLAVAFRKVAESAHAEGVKEERAWTDEDKPLPEDDAIAAVFPTRIDTSAAHAMYAEARRLVGAKRSKFALIDLVNWLLHRIEASKTEVPSGCLTPEKAAQACRNIGFDLTCGACATVFYTGHGGVYAHEPTCSTTSSDAVGYARGVEQEAERRRKQCKACSIEAEYGDEEDPHPVPRRLHRCVEDSPQKVTPACACETGFAHYVHARGPHKGKCVDCLGERTP